MSKSKKSEKTQVRLDRFLADAGAGTRSEVKKMNLNEKLNSGFGPNARVNSI